MIIFAFDDRPSMIRILLFEDNRNFREAMAEAFDDSSKVFLANSFEDANNSIAHVREYRPDVVLMDIEMPGKSGLDALKDIKEACPGTKIMIQTQYEDEHRIFVALCRGALGYALKSDSFEKLESAIEDVHRGGGYFSAPVAAKVTNLFQSREIQKSPEYTPLTDRETEVLSYLAKAYKYQAIADVLHISYESVHSHVKNIYNKLHVNSKPEAILKALEGKLI